MDALSNDCRDPKLSPWRRQLDAVLWRQAAPPRQVVRPVRRHGAGDPGSAGPAARAHGMDKPLRSSRLGRMGDELLAFLGISALVIVTPGQDTALTIRNTLTGGRRAGPPEDCGGIPGYENCVAVALDKATGEIEDPEELRKWLGDWHPERFDLAAAKKRFDL